MWNMVVKNVTGNTVQDVTIEAAAAIDEATGGEVIYSEGVKTITVKTDKTMDTTLVFTADDGKVVLDLTNNAKLSVANANKTIDIGDEADVTIKGGTVEAPTAGGSTAGIRVKGANSNLVLEDVNVGGSGTNVTGIIIGANDGNQGGSEITLNNCTVTGGFMGLTVNGTMPAQQVTLNITGGIITGGGVYLAGPSTTTITGAICEATDGESSGLEIRDGNVTVTGGEIRTNATSTGANYQFNGGGSCCVGAALALIPHGNNNRQISFSIDGTKIVKTGTGAEGGVYKAIIFDDTITGAIGTVNVL